MVFDGAWCGDTQGTLSKCAGRICGKEDTGEMQWKKFLKRIRCTCYMKKAIGILLCAIFMVSCGSPDRNDPKNINSYDRPFAIETMQKIITALD